MDKYFISFTESDAIAEPEGNDYFNRIWEVPVGLNDRYLNYRMKITNVVSSQKHSITDGTAAVGQNVSVLLEVGMVQTQNNLNTKGKQIVGVVQTLNATNICGLQINNPNVVSISNIRSGDRIQFNDGDFVVQVGSLELDASNIEISSTNASMSLGEGNIILDGANNKIKVGKTSNKQVEIVGSSTQGYIATGKSSATDNTAGFWLANNNTDPEFAVGNANDKIVFNGGSLDISSQNLEISSSTLQVSTAEQSMSLGHNNSNKYGKIILQGSGTPKLAIGSSAHQLSLTNGSGIFIDGDGNFRMGDDDG